MPVVRSHGRSQQQQPNHHQQHRPGVPKIKSPALHLVQQKQNAQSDQDRRAHQPADRATLTAAANLCAHSVPLSTRSADAVLQQQYSDADQDQREKHFAYPQKIEYAEILQQEQRAQCD